MLIDKNRVAWTDIAKAFAIFFIVWGHAASGSEVFFFRNVLYSFHIPAFLIIAGFWTKDLVGEDLTFKGFLLFLKKQALQLLVPYLFWGIFFSNFSMKNVLPILYGSYQSIKTVNPVGALWFVPTFFVARVVVRLIMMAVVKIKRNAFILAPASVLACAGGILLPLLDNGYPFSINIALMFVGFILAGYLSKGLLDKLANAKLLWRIVAFFASLIMFAIGTFFRSDALELVCFYKGEYGNLFWFFYNAIFGALATAFLGMILAKWQGSIPVKILRFIGSESLGIMFVHVPFIRQIAMPLFNAIGFTSPLWLEALCAAIIATALSVGLVILFKILAPKFLGKK